MITTPPPNPRNGSSGDRLLAVLSLFTVDKPEWTVEEAAVRLAVSATTSYRYFKALTRAGLISPVAGAGYTLGPAIVQMDRQIQLSDRMLGAARAVMNDLAAEAPPGAIILLCRLFHDRVICVHQALARGPQEPVSYERGRPMPLFRGATSKIILAHLPLRSLRSLFVANGEEISAAALGNDWDQFRRTLAGLRRDGVAITTGDIDPGRVGIAAPIFDAAESVLGSLSYVLPKAQTDAAALARLAARIGEGARLIEEEMTAETTPPRSSPARLRVTG